MDKYDISQLTEFPRFEPESSQSGVSSFFNKLWKIPIFSPSDGNENMQNKAIEDAKPVSSPSEGQNKQVYEDAKPETGAYAVEFEGRSLHNVLRRISSLVALGSGGGTRYADTELARYWMPDDISRECYECASRFSALRRRHHCRVCGQIFCSRCCSQRVPGQIFGCAGGLRVCNYCCNIVLSYLKENDANGDMSTDLRTLQENLQVKFPDNKSHSSSPRDNFLVSGEAGAEAGAGAGPGPGAEREPRAAPREPAPLLFRRLVQGLRTQTHRYRLVRYNGVWRGCDILQWIMDNTNYKTRAQATIVSQSLLNSGYMECMTELPQFADYALYRPLVVPSEAEESPVEEHTRLVESVSSYCLDLNLGDSSARLIKATKTERKSTTSSEEENPVIDHSEGHTETKNMCPAILNSGEEHLRLLMRQCLARASVPASWADVLYPLCQHAADIVMPDLYGNDIDVRNYVQVKKVAGGSMSDSCVVQGVVMTKNVAHRGMPQQISNPTILLLDCSIAYQRVEGKLTSLEPVLMQEQEYLVRCAARITALRPRVVLVRGSAARAVQDALRHEGVALAAGVRAPALQRVSRCARAEVVTSIDARIGTPRLGTCRDFYVKNYESKTVMVLEGCAEPHLGCCIILRGASLQELVRVKKVVKFMLLACYNWKLEKAFLGDIEALLPEPGMTFGDDTSDGNDVFKTEMKCNDEMKINEKDIEVGNVNESLDKVIDNDLKGDDKFDDKNKDAIKSTSKVDDNNQIDTKSEADDPLQKSKTFIRKTDSDKTLSCGVPIRDFSDPLRATLSGDDEVFLPKEEAKLKTDDSHGDRWSVDDAVLSMSPNVVIPAPYLETEAGRRCPLRKYFPAPLLRRGAPPTPRVQRGRGRVARESVQVKEIHPFILHPITAPADDPALRAALAHYRATGCRLSNNNHRPGCPQYKPSVLKKVQKEAAPETEKQNENEPLDPLAPENHQRLSVLLYSFSTKSANVPDFCVNPWIATMEMYGQRDISLGSFLEKYCFNGEFKCPSNTCQVPMNQHVRRFVHGDVCITITCNTVGHSNVDKIKEEQSKQVMFWSRCDVCGAVGRAGRLSRAALALSLAAYVRLRCMAGAGAGAGAAAGAGAGRYVRRACPHPLHAHAHAFVCRLTSAFFRFSKIQTYDIQLPPEIIHTKYDTKQMRDSLLAQINELMPKGHETFSGVSDPDAEKEYQGFKQHVEQIHLALTSSHLQEQTTLAAVVRSLWSVTDRVTAAEKMLRDAQDKWAGPPAKPARPPGPLETTVEDKSDIEDSSDTNDTTTYVFDAPKEAEREHGAGAGGAGGTGGTGGAGGADEDEEKGDKKTVRQILSQLLSNNSANSNQSGIIISTGLIPVVVMAGEIGSVIAATLASVTYQKTLTQLPPDERFRRESSGIIISTGLIPVVVMAGEIGSVIAATLASVTYQKTLTQLPPDDGESDKERDAKKFSDHVEVLLKDGLLCRVYYARQFHKLRHMVLAPLDCNPYIADEFAPTGGSGGGGGGGGGPARGEGCCDERDREGKSLCDIEEGFTRSLAYCVPWAAKGGKSGSTFCKTKDDRYVLKEMTKPEWQQFLEFAPHYFSYVTNCHQNKQPSLLARILGVYSVGGAGNGVLVMENIWYGMRAGGPRFDLKGASRHRLTADTQPSAVLMDENLLNLRWEKPLYIRSHAGGVLFGCIARDTDFLAAHCVMDYSLLLGIDGTTLLAGLIDYIRTFTWDKKLEHLVKKNLGSGQPTVVSPAEYKRRFAAAARKYFLPCVSHWDHLYQPSLVAQLHK